MQMKNGEGNILSTYSQCQLGEFGLENKNHPIHMSYLMGPYNAGPNFTPALITPLSKIPFPPFRAGVKRAL